MTDIKVHGQQQIQVNKERINLSELRFFQYLKVQEFTAIQNGHTSSSISQFTWQNRKLNIKRAIFFNVKTLRWIAG